MSGRPIVTCKCCGQMGEHQGRGLVKGCYGRHHYRGTLDQFPARPVAPPWIPRRRDAVAKFARYGELIAEGARPSRIRWELSASQRQLERWAAAWNYLFGGGETA